MAATASETGLTTAARYARELTATLAQYSDDLQSAAAAEKEYVNLVHAGEFDSEACLDARFALARHSRAVSAAEPAIRDQYRRLQTLRNI